jgi:hypothetical protein
LLTAILFAVFLRKFRSEYPAVELAGQVYLYYVAARLTIPAIMIPFCVSALDLWARVADADEATVKVLSQLLIAAWIIWGVPIMANACRTDLRHIFEMDERGSAMEKKWIVWWPLVWASAITGACIGVVFAAVNTAAFVFYYWK